MDKHFEEKTTRETITIKIVLKENQTKLKSPLEQT